MREGRAQGSRPLAFVYVVKSASGLVKIGVAADPIERLSVLQTASKETLELVYAAAVRGNYGYAIEQVAHSTLRHHRVNGEWFNATSELAVAAIAAASHCLNDPVVEVPGKIKAIIETDVGKDKRPRRSRFTLATFAVAITTALLFILVRLIST